MSHKVYSNGRVSHLLTHMMRSKEVAGPFPDKPAQAENVRHSGSVAPSKLLADAAPELLEALKGLLAGEDAACSFEDYAAASERARALGARLAA